MKTYYSLFETAQEEIGDYYWLSGGPWLDAQDEESLEDAIWHCQNCCECVVDEAKGPWNNKNSEFIPLESDLVFLHYIKQNLVQTDENNWLPQVEQMLTFATLKSVV